MAEEKTEKKFSNKRSLSFSRDYLHLVERLNELPNPNRFICEAIAEKFERLDNPAKGVSVTEMAEVLGIYQQAFGNLSPILTTTPVYVNPTETKQSVTTPIAPVETVVPTEEHRAETVKEQVKEEVKKEEPKIEVKKEKQKEIITINENGTTVDLEIEVSSDEIDNSTANSISKMLDF